jgi:hypothetical protein
MISFNEEILCLYGNFVLLLVKYHWILINSLHIKQPLKCTVKFILGHFHPVILSSFVVHTLCVFFKGSRFYFTLFHLHSSPVSIETIPNVRQCLCIQYWESLRRMQGYTLSSILCVVSFHFMVLYTIELLKT